VGGHQVPDSIVEGARFNLVAQPAGFFHMPDQGQFRFSGRPVVEVWRISSTTNIAGCSHLRELNLARDHAPISTPIRARILDGVLQVNECTHILVHRVLVDQDGTLSQEVPVPFED